jgi:HlyD family secretion protein
VKKRTIIYLLILVAAIAIACYWFFGRSGSNATQYEYATVTRGNVENTVSATGTMTPVTTVEVGTQTSGTIDSVFVDYNDRVKQGQILAVLDTTLLKTTLLDAQATLARAEAQLQQAQADYDRNKSLFDRKMIAEADFLTYQVNLKAQQAALKSAEASVQRAKRNIEFAVIQSPITGIVISKNVETGQTVAASLSTPTLFEIAQDLSRMEILVDVDESDIGLIKEGQNVRFTVAAYSDEEFTGTVKQIRLQPKTVSNVVTYTAVVEASNDKGLLLPGMTATVDFITDQRTDVLLVPNKALRFSPTTEQIAQARERRMQSREADAGGRGGAVADTLGGHQGMGMMRPGGVNGERPKDAAVVWCLDSLGQLSMAPFRAGLSDGTNTEVVMSRSLSEGKQIIIGIAGQSSTQSTTRSGADAPHGPGPGRMFGF